MLAWNFPKINMTVGIVFYDLDEIPLVPLAFKPAKFGACSRMQLQPNQAASRTTAIAQSRHLQYKLKLDPDRHQQAGSLMKDPISMPVNHLQPYKCGKNCEEPKQ
eukprot:Gb_16323 [translate_table: standard]